MLRGVGKVAEQQAVVVGWEQGELSYSVDGMRVFTSDDDAAKHRQHEKRQPKQQEKQEQPHTQTQTQTQTQTEQRDKDERIETKSCASGSCSNRAVDNEASPITSTSTGADAREGTAGVAATHSPVYYRVLGSPTVLVPSPVNVHCVSLCLSLCVCLSVSLRLSVCLSLCLALCLCLA